MLPWVRCCVLATLAASPSLASGSYVTRPPLPATHDSARYELGKAIALGRTPVEAVRKSEAEAQARRLTGLQDQLPKRVRTTLILPALAGRLTETQMGALEYYLRVRYKIK